MSGCTARPRTRLARLLERFQKRRSSTYEWRALQTGSAAEGRSLERHLARAFADVARRRVQRGDRLDPGYELWVAHLAETAAVALVRQLAMSNTRGMTFAHELRRGTSPRSRCPDDRLRAALCNYSGPICSCGYGPTQEDRRRLQRPVQILFAGKAHPRTGRGRT